MKAIAFDFDGTLIDSMGMWRNLGRNFVESKGEEYTDAIHDQITTMSLRQSSAFFKRELELSESVDEIFDEMGAILLDGYGKHLPLKEGAMEAIEKARRLGPVVLATATSQELLMPALHRFNMDQCFDFIQTCDGVGLEKSDTAFYDTLAHRLNASPGEIILVDDAHYALAAAKKAGLYVVAVKDTYNLPYRDAIVKESDELLDSLLDFEPERYF